MRLSNAIGFRVGAKSKEAGKGIHIPRVPIFLGSVENVFELNQFHKYYEEDGGDRIGAFFNWLDIIRVIMIKIVLLI